MLTVVTDTHKQVPTIFVLENLRRDALREALKAKVRGLIPLCYAAQRRGAEGEGEGEGAKAAEGRNGAVAESEGEEEGWKPG
jgi:hypothetical protein